MLQLKPKTANGLNQTTGKDDVVAQDPNRIMKRII